MEQEERLCDEEETGRDFTCLGDRESTGGGCEVVVTAKIRCGWVKLRECSELLYGRRFPLKLKRLFIRVMQSQQYREVLCLKEIEMQIVSSG